MKEGITKTFLLRGNSTVTTTALSRQAETLPPARSPSARPHRSRSRKAQANARLALGGRYDADAGKAIVPANGLASSRSRNVPTTVAAVPDPFDPRGRIAVSVNRKVDALEWEHSHGRLSQAAYLTGRQVQAVLERAYCGRSASNWMGGDRVDAYAVKEMQIITGLEKAETVKAYMEMITRSVGQIGARFLKAVLLEGLSYADLAKARGRDNEAGRSAAASQFRNLLEDLSVDWSAVGAR